MSLVQQKRYASRTCAWCSGVGEASISRGHITSCLVCGGKGHVYIIEPVEECRQCEGTGRRKLSSACLTCAGTGWAHVVGQGAKV